MTNTSIRETKYKIGDLVNVCYTTTENVRVVKSEIYSIIDVVYDLEKHTPDTYMYVCESGSGFSLWFESELSLVEGMLLGNISELNDE
jgi:hypothetical protein